MKNEPVLKGKGFILRPYKKEDYISLAKNANNKKIAKNMFNGFPSPYTIEGSKKWIEVVLKGYENTPITSFVIDVDGKAVGAIGGETHWNEPFAFSFGYWLGEKYWGKGIMSEAVALFTEYIFKVNKKVIRIHAKTFLRNKGSQGVLLKNGFMLEGTLRNSHIKDGKIVDEYLFSKLRNDR